MRYSDLDKAALQAELSRVQQDYEALRGYKLNLNLTRGKPETAQLALSDGLFHTLDNGDFTIDGVDVAGRTIALIGHIPGNVLAGNWRVAVHLDDKTSPAQEKAILDVYTGKLGGPVADLVKLIGEVVSVEKVPITFTVQGGHGVIKIGEDGYAELSSYTSAAGKTTTLADTIFSTVPGAPVFVGKADRYRAKKKSLGIDVDLVGYNALQSTFVFSA